MEEQTRSGFVALIGRPNVGKSTLMNQIIGQKIAITSPRPQTTRNRIQTVYTEERGQIVFVDTPGIHQAKNKLGDYMMNIASRSMQDVDVIMWLVEPSDKIGRGEQNIVRRLQNIRIPVILVMNKIDTVKRPELLKYIDAYRKVYDFSEIIPVSALTGENVQDILDTLYGYLPEGPYFFDEDTVTDQPMRQIAAELIREKALRCLEKEIPHGIAVVIEKMEYRQSGKGIYDVEATIICERDSHKGIVIGKGGAMLKKIGSLARPEIEDLLEAKVNLKLWVKVRKDWRDSDLLIRNFGYRKEDYTKI